MRCVVHARNRHDPMMIAVSSDEATTLTDYVLSYLRARGHSVSLFGVLAGRDSEWVDSSSEAAESVASGTCREGVLFCWTGTGACIAANKVRGIRAALCTSARQAEGARKWDHANVLVMGLEETSIPKAKAVLDAWFSTSFGNTDFEKRNILKLDELDRARGD